MKCSHLIGGAIFASALLGSAAFAFAEDAAPPADTGAAPPAADAAAAPAPKVAKKATKPAAAAMWTGKALQVGHSKGYTVTLKVSAKAMESEYPELACGGKLTKVGAKGDSSFYIETITHGALDKTTGKGCIDGTVTLIKSGEGYIWGWVGQYDGKPIVAYAALGKQAMPAAEAPAPTSAPAAKGAAPAQ